jgi:hypothetical protein
MLLTKDEAVLRRAGLLVTNEVQEVSLSECHVIPTTPWL